MLSIYPFYGAFHHASGIVVLVAHKDCPESQQAYDTLEASTAANKMLPRDLLASLGLDEAAPGPEAGAEATEPDVAVAWVEVGLGRGRHRHG